MAKLIIGILLLFVFLLIILLFFIIFFTIALFVSRKKGKKIELRPEEPGAG